MELKAGYKLSEIGVIPDDWQVERISDLGFVVRGGSPRPAGDPRYFNGSYIPWLTVAALTNVPDYQLVITETVGYLTEEGSKHSRTLGKGTLIIANSGATLGVAKVLGVKCCANDGIAAIIDQKRGDKIFLSHYINTQTNKLREVIATGNGQPNLNTGLIKKILVPFPDEDEQGAIGEALNDMDALLEALERLVAKKHDLKQAAMQQLLTGQTRLPGFNGEWQQRRLGDFANSIAGGTPSTQVSSYWGGSIRWMSSGELNLKRIYEVEGRITNAGFNNSSTHMLPAKCVLVGLAGQGKTRGTVAMNFVELCTNQSIAAILPNAAFAPEYLYYNLDARYEELRDLSSGGGGRGGLNLTLINNLIVAFPPVAEQEAIGAALTDMDAEIAALEQRLVKTRDLRQGMMQELLTGKTRLVLRKAFRA